VSVLSQSHSDVQETTTWRYKSSYASLVWTKNSYLLWVLSPDIFGWSTYLGYINMWAWSNNHTMSKMSRRQTDGGTSQLLAMFQGPRWDVQETNRCRYKSSYAKTGLDNSHLYTCERHLTEVWVGYWPLLVCNHCPKMHTSKYVITITLRWPRNKLMERRDMLSVAMQGKYTCSNIL